MAKLLATICLGLVSLYLTGCGQAGPLYLPQQNTSQQNLPQPSTSR